MKDNNMKEKYPKYKKHYDVALKIIVAFDSSESRKDEYGGKGDQTCCRLHEKKYGRGP